MTFPLLLEPSDFHCVAAAVVLTACVLLARHALSGQAWASAAAGRSPKKDELDTAARDFQDLDIPQHPHLEFATGSDSGLQWSNPRDVWTFDSELCSGTFLYFHKPTCEGPEGSGGLDYGGYFKGKKRLWELRLSLRFKQPPPPDADMFFGIELERYVPLNEATKRVVSAVTTAVRKTLGAVYQSVGEDPKVVAGECEKPVCVLPLWAFDQFIETPEGEEPPSLTDPRFPEMGHRRTNRVAEYAKEVAALKQSFQPGRTYTFALWGPSRFLDAINWRVVGIPLITPFDFDKVAGGPPVHTVLYALSPSGDPKDGRHLVSRKRYCFRAAIWSSDRRPPRERFDALCGAKTVPDAAPPSAPPKNLLRRQLGNMGKAIKLAAAGSVYCCTGAAPPRPRKDRRGGA